MSQDEKPESHDLEHKPPGSKMFITIVVLILLGMLYLKLTGRERLGDPTPSHTVATP